MTILVFFFQADEGIRDRSPSRGLGDVNKRQQYGSANPTAIIAPAIAATLVSTLIAIVYCKIKDHTGSRNAQAQVQEKSYKALSAEGKDRGGKAV